MSSPSVKLAQLLTKKYALKPPIDVESLIKNYAELRYEDIPFSDIDGISINLKASDKKTKVIVNSNQPPLRQRFTLAHELGHIIIPWHTGSIVDQAYDPSETESSDYWQIEEEANSFAAELLMPAKYIEHLISITDDLAILHKTICDQCKTSSLAASVQLTKLLPKNIVFACEQNGLVRFSGKTQGTIANKLRWDTEFPSNPYDYAENYYKTQMEGQTLHWWRTPDEIILEPKDDRCWRDILDKILLDSHIPVERHPKVKSSINGTIAFANGSAKMAGDYNLNSVVSASIQRLKDRPEFEWFTKHADFEDFIFKKAQSLSEK